MLNYEDEYRAAGFPVMTDIFTIRQFRNIIVAWMVGITGTSLFLVLSGLWIFPVSKIIIIVLNLLILGLFLKQLFFSEAPRYKILFITLNTFLVVVLCLVIVEKVLS
jgi:heme O synthase-like polyprenyltransferase